MSSRSPLVPPSPPGSGLAAPGGRLLALSELAAVGPAAASQFGAKAARLAAALRSGLPVLPGWVVPVSEGRTAAQAGADALAAAGLPAGRRAVLALALDPELRAELRAAVQLLGGRVIVRSSSPLESDARWSGAFSSVTEVGPDDVAAAVRSCWAAAFAVDPLERLTASGLPATALELGLLIQPQLRPDTGGVARVMGAAVSIEGVAGHPGALLAGWAEGATAQVRLDGGGKDRPAAGLPTAGDGGLAALAGADTVAAVAALAARVARELGDDIIEWAAADGTVWLLQSLRSTVPQPAPAGPARPAAPAGAAASAPAAAAGLTGADPEAAWARLADPADPRLAEAAAASFQAPPGAADGLAARRWMPLLAEVAQAQGRHVPARPAAPGTAAGLLVRCRPHERPDGGGRDAILLIDRPLPALAPLLFGARGVITRTGAAGSHLAEVARSLGVPMVIGCQLDAVLGPDPDARDWIAAIDGEAGDVALLPAF
ncbi:MAG: PEP/pyruvate-binding domain-containing protein [Gemmatimonadota bacterium]